MKTLLLPSALLCALCFIACKKYTNFGRGDVTTPEFLDQSVSYRTFATKASPADSARGKFKDSIMISRRVNKGDLNFLSNMPNVRANIIGSKGFSFGFEDRTKPSPYFLFTANAFPNVPIDIELNKKYENITPRVDLSPIYLGSGDGTHGMNYFVDNVYPPDAGSITSKTYTSIVFNKYLKVPLIPYYYDTAYIVSGHINGYSIKYYHETDTTKYVQRWDFTIEFSDLRFLK